LRWESVKRVLEIGVPAALMQVINPIGLAAMTLLCAHAFQEPGAIAMSLGFRVEFFAYLPAVGYGFAAMTMIGQNIGAEKLARAQETLRSALRYSCGIAFTLGALAAIFAPQIIAVFTDEPVVTGYTIAYFRTVALSYAFLAAMMVEGNAFQAIGKSWPGFWIQCIRYFGVALPLGYLFAVVLGLPIVTVWASIIAGNVVASAVGYVWIWSRLKRFDFHEVEETTHRHVRG
jgi:Na+-driven multidrug efflux pump